MDLNKPNYQAWLIDEKDFPKDGTIEEKIWFLVGYGILAPSTHNTQPWEFEVVENKLIIGPNLSLKLPMADPVGRNLSISLGALIFNVIVAASYFNFASKITFSGDSLETAKAIIAFVPTSKPDQILQQLFPQITRRYSEKRIIKSLPIHQEELQKLNHIVWESASSYLINDSTDINALSKLCFKAAAYYANEPQFAKELSSWLRSNKTSEMDGMPGFMNGLSNLKNLIGKTLMKKQPKALKVMAKKYLKVIQTSPAVGIIATKQDDWKDWIDAGLTYEKVSLMSASKDICLSPIAAPIERPERKNLAEYLPDTHKFPQIFFRMTKPQDGIGQQRSPRRLVSENNEMTLVNHLKSKGINVSLNSAQIDGKNINFIKAGNGKPLLLIHGANMGWGQWYTNIIDLAKKYEVYAIDLPGSGQSTRFDYQKADFDKDYVNLVKQFIKNQDLERPDIIGHSFGAAIAAKLALGNSELVNKIVLVNPLGLITKVPLKQRPITFYGFAKFIAKTGMKPTRKNMKSFLESAVVNKSVITNDFIDYYFDSINQDKRSHPLLFMHGQTRGFRFNPDLVYVDSLQSIKSPVLVILGENDPLLPSKKIASLVRGVKNVKLKMFKNTGHVAPLEQKALFSKEVLNFLK